VKAVSEISSAETVPDCQFDLTPARSSLRKYQHGAHYKNLRKIRYWEILTKSVDKFQIWLKSGTSHEDLSAVFLLPATLNLHKSAFSEGNGIRLLE